MNHDVPKSAIVSVEFENVFFYGLDQFGFAKVFQNAVPFVTN